MVRTFRTTLRVTEDERDSDGVLRITFELLKSVRIAGIASSLWTNLEKCHELHVM
jgi:hypothetical protein